VTYQLVALPSCIKASIQYVSSAPAKRSVFVYPFITGIAMKFSAKSAYTFIIFLTLPQPLLLWHE
jgi:hypothetical protein